MHQEEHTFVLLLLLLSRWRRMSERNRRRNVRCQIIHCCHMKPTPSPTHNPPLLYRSWLHHYHCLLTMNARDMYTEAEPTGTAGISWKAKQTKHMKQSKVCDVVSQLYTTPKTPTWPFYLKLSVRVGWKAGRDAGPRGSGYEATVSLIFIILLSGSMIIRGTHLIRFQWGEPRRVGYICVWRTPKCKWYIP